MTKTRSTDVKVIGRWVTKKYRGRWETGGVKSFVKVSMCGVTNVCSKANSQTKSFYQGQVSPILEGGKAYFLAGYAKKQAGGKSV